MVATTRFGSVVRSSLLNPLGAVVASEQDKAPISARAVGHTLVNVRFTRTPMNRAMCFTKEVTSSVDQYRAGATQEPWTRVTTGNAVRTARIYIRQARHWYRHLCKR